MTFYIEGFYSHSLKLANVGSKGSAWHKSEVSSTDLGGQKLSLRQCLSGPAVHTFQIPIEALLVFQHGIGICLVNTAE